MSVVDYQPCPPGTDKKERYARLVEVLESVSREGGAGSRQRITRTLEEYFVEVLRAGKEELKLAVGLLLCRPRPGPVNRGSQLNVGKALIKQAVEVIDPSAARIAEEHLEQGTADDWGTAVQKVFESRGGLRLDALSLQEARDKLLEIGDASGSGAVQLRANKLAELVQSVAPVEAKYLVRTLLGRGLRVGAKEATVMRALVRSIPAGAEMEGMVKSHNDVGKIVEALISKRPDVLGIQLGTPISPMTARPAGSIEEVCNALCGASEGSPAGGGAECTADWKYDGVRLQIHVGPECEKLFSRNLLDTTLKYPEALQMARDSLREGVESVILDTEIVAVGDDGKLLPFQALTRRPNVVGPEQLAGSMRVNVFVFDCLMMNGQSFVHLELQERLGELSKALRFKEESPLKLAKSRKFSSAAELRKVLLEAVADSTEGLMVKRLDGKYEPGKRSSRWLKLKKDYLEDSLCDSIDAVVVGANYGNGKRSGRFGSFLLAVRGKDGEMQTLCRVGTGLTDADVDACYEVVEAAEDEPPAGWESWPKSLKPDKWVKDGPVWELRGSDLTISRTHTCASDLLGGSRGPRGGVGTLHGIALRFPRVIRMRDREDKDASQATTAEEVLYLYRQQASKVDLQRPRQSGQRGKRQSSSAA